MYTYVHICTTDDRELSQCDYDNARRDVNVRESIERRIKTEGRIYVVYIADTSKSQAMNLCNNSLRHLRRSESAKFSSTRSAILILFHVVSS